jgi:hypothetical protein
LKQLSTFCAFHLELALWVMRSLIIMVEGEVSQGEDLLWCHLVSFASRVVIDMHWNVWHEYVAFGLCSLWTMGNNLSRLQPIKY